MDLQGAVILAGGFGTRLQHVVQDVPKPMAPVGGKPFLAYVLNRLDNAGIREAVLAVGYKKECIEDFFGARYKSISISYSEEDKPLLTGGAVKKALGKIRANDVFVINGDTLFDVDFNGIRQYHKEKDADLTIAVKQMEDTSRYGTIAFDEDGRVLRFVEKQELPRGFINGGVYLMKRELLEQVPKQVFSFETDFMEKQAANHKFYCWPDDGYFIDIGIPEDYERAQRELCGGA